MPPLPANADAAAAAGADTALAFAIESARRAIESGSAPEPRIRDLFTASLARLIRNALAPEGGDPSFQALVLRAQDAQVDQHVRLAARTVSDERAVRSAVDAIAHPGKLHGMPPGALRDALAGLHALASTGAWSGLGRAAEQSLLLVPSELVALRVSLAAIASHSSLERLQQGQALLSADGVQRYRALCARRGPLAGTDAAAAQGRASAQLGGAAEHATVQAFREIAALLDRHAVTPARHHVVRSLKTPRGFPGPAGKAKDEWDAAIVRVAEAAPGAEILLLAEVKAAPAAATPDFSRLLGGLRRLAQADSDAVLAFPSADGDVRILGASLRRLEPPGLALPPHVIYCCSAPVETQPQVLGAATRAVLLAEPASLAFAARLARGELPAHDALAEVWHALGSASRLRAALHQHQTTLAVRAAMLRPEDLLAAVVQAMPATPPAAG